MRITLRGIAADGIILAVALAGWVAPTGWVDRRRGVLIGAAVRILCVLVLGVLVLVLVLGVLVLGVLVLGVLVLCVRILCVLVLGVLVLGVLCRGRVAAGLVDAGCAVADQVGLVFVAERCRARGVRRGGIGTTSVAVNPLGLGVRVLGAWAR
ncbi:hypothetical protein [Frankia casuarinae]|uniref:hypothetical protein n=1 Tax=Frankia casuarinae (strain DSM 45818 / CECT 9043 / HFP020203 / CcI3) TaxID=106370 RepID=UPI0011D0784E|nr:hypothetical protein [Frankia casuarinae]